MAKQEFLFSSEDWFTFQEYVQKELISEVSEIDKEMLFHTSTEDICNRFEQKYRIDMPILLEQQRTTESIEVDVDISQDQKRAKPDQSRPNSTGIKVTIPFEGERVMFNIQSSADSDDKPIGNVYGDNLFFTIWGTELSPEKVEKEIDQNISIIKYYLNDLNRSVSVWNQQIKPLIQPQIENQKKKLLANKKLIDSFNYHKNEY